MARSESLERTWTEAIWASSFYELALEFGIAPAAILMRAIEAIWEIPEIAGPYDRLDVPLAQRERVPPDFFLRAGFGEHAYGAAVLPDGNIMPCGVGVVRDSPGGWGRWINFYVPFRALELTYEIDYDKPERWKPWVEPLDAWLADVAKSVYRSAPFKLALIGEEVVGVLHADELDTDMLGESPHPPILAPTDSGDLKWYSTDSEAQS
jgi:hypothetical protein